MKKDKKETSSNSKKVDRVAFDEEEIRQEIVSILDSTAIEVHKDWQKKLDYQRFKKEYETVVDDLPNVINIFIKLEEIWNINKFLENPTHFINLFQIMSYRIEHTIITYDVEELKTIHHVNMFLIGTLLKLICQISVLVAYLDITQPKYEENSHTKQLIRVLVEGFMKFVKSLTIQYRSIQFHDTHIIAPQKLKKYPMVEDIKTLSDSYIHSNVFASLSAIKEIKHILYCFYNFLRINKDNWKEDCTGCGSGSSS
ncbi:hypothetical protein ACTFIT_006754 [Dictyostelium discoideum]